MITMALEFDIFDNLVQDMCTKATEEALAEIEAENQTTSNDIVIPVGPGPVQLSVWENQTTSNDIVIPVGPGPVQLSVWGDWKPRLPLPCPAPASRIEMMTPRWGKYLEAPKTYSDVEAIHVRNVSLTKSWQTCDPENEDMELRKKHSERVQVWRNLLATNKTDFYLPGVFNYKTTVSLLDNICPIKKTKLEQSFEVIDLKDIIPVIIVNSYDGEAEVPLPLTNDNKPGKSQKRNKKKQKKNRFLSCFGK